MNPPNPFTLRKAKGYSMCIACEGWFEHNQIFFAEGVNWVLCKTDWTDYWENTDEIPEDYKWYDVGI